MSTVKVVLYKSKTLKNGEHPILIRFIKDRKPKYIKTGYNCRLDLWDEKNNCPKNKHPNKLLLETVIDEKKIEAQRIILEYEKEKENYSLEDIKKRMQAKTRNVSVLNYIDELITGFKKANQLGNANVYTDLKRALKKAYNDQDMNFKNLNYSFLMKFEQSFRSTNAKETSISYYMRTLRAVYNRAIKEKVCKKDDYPFDDYKISKFNTETRKRAITKDDILKITLVELENEKHIDARNYFLFMYYTMGLNFTDLSLMKWSNIHNNRLSYTRVKTGKIYGNIELLEPALNILNYYRSIFYQGKEGYIFPILILSRHKEPQTIENRIHKIIGQVNKSLKKIAEKAGINVNLTTYVSRHSFATNLKKSGVSITQISGMMGHSSEKTTQIYLDSFEMEVFDEANKKLL